MLYHKDVNMPDEIRNIAELTWELEPTLHAQNKAHERDIVIPFEVTFSGENIFEAEITDKGTVTKLGIRTDYDDCDDICIIIVADKNGSKKIATLYLNDKNDNHSTLREEHYS